MNQKMNSMIPLLGEPARLRHSGGPVPTFVGRRRPACRSRFGEGRGGLFPPRRGLRGGSVKKDFHLSGLQYFTYSFILTRWDLPILVNMVL